MTAIEGATIHVAGAGKRTSALGANFTLKAGTEDTDGAWSFFEYEAPPGFGGPPAHTHGRMIEGFYVLEGTLQIRLGEREVALASDAFALVPAGVVHTFSNPGAAQTRFLLLVSPAGFEKYFDDLRQLVKAHGYPPPPEFMADLGRRYDFKPVGPPQGS